MRAAVIGHVEWIDFVRVPALPREGDIVHSTESWEEPGGGGAVSAVQLMKLAGGCTFFTALGDDDRGHLAHKRLGEMGLQVEAIFRPEPQRRAVTHIGEHGERTITVLGTRLGPTQEDPLPWEILDDADVVFITACDAATVRRARSARALVATSRAAALLAEAGAELDALVGSGSDPAERYSPGDIEPPPRLVVRTAGAQGGTFQAHGGSPRRFDPAPPPGPPIDAYGCGDSFAAGLAFALARGDAADDAVAFAARCGAAVLSGRGPYTSQLTEDQT